MFSSLDGETLVINFLCLGAFTVHGNKVMKSCVPRLETTNFYVKLVLSINHDCRKVKIEKIIHSCNLLKETKHSVILEG